MRLHLVLGTVSTCIIGTVQGVYSNNTCLIGYICKRITVSLIAWLYLKGDLFVSEISTWNVDIQVEMLAFSLDTVLCIIVWSLTSTGSFG